MTFDDLMIVFKNAARKGMSYGEYNHDQGVRAVVEALRDEFIVAAASGMAAAPHINTGIVSPGVVEKIADKIVADLITLEELADFVNTPGKNFIAIAEATPDDDPSFEALVRLLRQGLDGSIHQLAADAIEELLRRPLIPGSADGGYLTHLEGEVKRLQGELIESRRNEALARAAMPAGYTFTRHKT
jgi:hypothetical protein